MGGSSPAGAVLMSPEFTSLFNDLNRAECQTLQATDTLRSRRWASQWRRETGSNIIYSRSAQQKRPMRKRESERLPLATSLISPPVHGGW